MPDRAGGPGPCRLRFHGGTVGALVPLVVFIVGAVWLGLSGSADVNAYWPLLTVSLICGLVLARNRRQYTEAALRGMGDDLVMIMIAAWLFASALGMLLQHAGFVEALVALGSRAGLGGGAFAVLVFWIAAVVGTSTGTSIGTIITTTPVLYPAGVVLGAHPVALMGAILGGAAFGDNLSPISDTTIASSLTQGADIGGTVRSRLVYALPAAGIASVGYAVLGSMPADSIAATASGAGTMGGADLSGWPMFAVPVVVIALCVAGRHLLEALWWGLAAAVGLALAFGLLTTSDLFAIDPIAGNARGLLLEGLQGGVGVSVFTILLLGVVGSLREAGLVEDLIAATERRAHGRRGGEAAIAGATILVNALTAHNTVTVVTLGEFARRTGQRCGVGRYRRANLLDVPANTLQHVLPYMTTVVIASSYSRAGAAFGAPALPPTTIGLANLHSWMLLAVVVFVVVTGVGADGRFDSGDGPESAAGGAALAPDRQPGTSD